MCSSQELSNKKVFPTFARTYPLSNFVIPSIQQLLRTFNWSSVAVVYSNDSGKYQETSGELLHALKDSITYKIAMKTTKYNPKEKVFENIMAALKKSARSKIGVRNFTFKGNRKGCLPHYLSFIAELRKVLNLPMV